MYLALFFTVFFTTQAIAVTDPAKKNKLRVGAIFPLTGSLSAYGKEALAGLEVAVKLTANQQGYQHIDVELLVRDSASSAKLAAKHATELIDKHYVHAFIGSVSSAATLSIAKVAQEKQKLHIVPISTATTVTKMGSHIYRSCVTDGYLGAVLAKFAVDNLKKRRAAILLEEGFSNRESAVARFRRYFQQHGGIIVEQLTYNRETLKRALRKIALQAPEIILLPTSYRVARNIISQAQRMKIQANFLGINNWKTTDNNTLTTSSRHFYVSHFSASVQTTNPAVAEFITVFEQANNRQPSEFAAMSYDALVILVDAVRRAGSVRAFPLLANLSRSKNVQGLLGDSSIDPNRNAIKPTFVVGLDGSVHNIPPIFHY